MVAKDSCKRLLSAPRFPPPERIEASPLAPLLWWPPDPTDPAVEAPLLPPLFGTPKDMPLSPEIMSKPEAEPPEFCDLVDNPSDCC